MQVLDHFTISVTSTPVSGETNSLVSGQSGNIKVTAIDKTGATMTLYRGTVQFSSGDAKATLPANYTYTSTDNGSHTFSVALKTVSGQSSTRDLTVKDTATGKSSTQNIDVWFNVIATVEGLVGQTTACGHVIANNDHFVALPVSKLCNVGVRVNHGAVTENTTVLDVGPWCPNTPSSTNSNTCSCSSDYYWQTSGVPMAVSLEGTCNSNGAGIDLANGTASDLGVAGLANIYWRFQ